MPVLPLLWPRLLQSLPSAASAVAWAISLFIAAWLISGWFWNQAAPAAISLPAGRLSDPLEAARGIVARQLMGAPRISSERAAREPSAQYRLLGAMTATGRTRGFAILEEGGKAPRAVLEGDEVAPGVTVEKVRADEVELRLQGRTELLPLAYRSPRSPPPAADNSRSEASANKRQ